MRNIHKHYSELIIAKNERRYIGGGQRYLKIACKRYNKALRQQTKIQLRGER